MSRWQMGTSGACLRVAYASAVYFYWPCSPPVGAGYSLLYEGDMQVITCICQEKSRPRPAICGPYSKGRVIPERGLSGGDVFDEKPFKAYAKNITPDPETGIGKWTEAQLIRGIREGLRPDGSLIGPPMPIDMYRRISQRVNNGEVATLVSKKPHCDSDSSLSAQ